MKKCVSRNGIISFWKFVFAIMLVILHASLLGTDNDFILFKNCSIGVDFFYLVAGYFLANSALKKEDSNDIGEDTIKFLWKKIKSFFPYVIIGFIIDIVLKTIYLDLDFKDYVLSIWDFLLLGMVGFKKTTINSPTWFLSALILCMLVIYPLLRKYKNNYLCICCPVIVFLLCGYISRNLPTLTSKSTVWIEFCYRGTLRAFLELNLGCFIYYISNKIKQINFTKLSIILMTVLEISCFLTIIISNIVIEKIKVYDFVLLLLLTIALTLVFTEKTLEFKIFSNKFFFFLEKISLPLFLVHHPIRLFFIESQLFATMSYIEKLIIYIFVSILAALISYFSIEKIKKLNLKRLFIIEEKTNSI